MAIEIKGLSKKFVIENKAKAVLECVDLKIGDGEMISIQGKSGAGKSTLMHILGLLDSPSEGTYMLDSIDTSLLSDKDRASLRNEKIGFVLQDFGLIEGESVYNNVRIPLLLGKCKLKDMKKLISDRLKQLGISDLADKNVSLLSGGEKQRVAIARAIVGNPKYIFADEPTGALDSKNADEVIEIFRRLNKKGNTVVIVTHDEQLAKKCDRIIYIADGKIVLERGAVERK